MQKIQEQQLPTICQVLHGLGVGGAEVLAARLARQLAHRFRFTFICLDELGTLGEQLRDEGFPVTVLGRRAGVDLKCTWRLAKLLRREQADIIHAHQYTPFFYAITARLLYRRAPVLFTEHGRWFPDYPRQKRILANRLLLARRDRVVAVGEHVRQALIDNEGIPAERTSVIYNGIDLSPFGHGCNGRLTTRQEMGVGTDDLVIIQVARLDALKDHATAIQTLAQVVQFRPNARLVLVGEGPELAGIQQLVRERGLEPNVRFMGLRRDVPRLLRAADLFLLSSKSEGIPLTVIEAMAAGLPVVSTNVGGVSEIIDHGQTGLLAPAGDADKLATNILELIRKPELHARVASLGQQRASTLFSESRMHDEYSRLFEEMIGHG